MCGLNAGVEVEKVGADAASELVRSIDSGACVDDFLQDQVNNVYSYTCTLQHTSPLF